MLDTGLRRHGRDGGRLRRSRRGEGLQRDLDNGVSLDGRCRGASIGGARTWSQASEFEYANAC